MRARDAPMRTATLALSVLASGLVLAQPAQPGGQREVRLTLHEGTSMAAALSPDGRTLAVDLLGALWTLNADGGTATRILDDGYDARMPAWSPDGRRIAFQGYRSSTWSIWTVAADGKDLQQVTVGSVRRSRAALVAGWNTDRVLVRSQRQLRRLGADARDRRGRADHHDAVQRLHAGLVAGRPRAGVRIRSARSARRLRRDRRRGAQPSGWWKPSRAHARRRGVLTGASWHRSPPARG